MSGGPSGQSAIHKNGSTSTNGHARGASGPPTMPHIDDIIHADVGLDESNPIETLLNAAELSMAASESLKIFHHPDRALKEYLKSYTLTVEVIPRHHDILSFQGDRRRLGERYTNLIRRIKAAHSSFETIKQDIKRDNARTGVQPLSPPQSRAAGNGNGNGVNSRPNTAPSASDRNRAANRNSMTSTWGMSDDIASAEHRKRASVSSNLSAAAQGRSPSAKVKPAIQPKPQALHGNVLKPGAQGAGQPPIQDLATRFANLRSTRSSAPSPSPSTTAAPVQDPRIRTQPIPVPIPPTRPAGPREMPTSPVKKPAISLEAALPKLPKVPDAIYSPARGSISSEAAELPSSTLRGMFSRANSIATFSTPSQTNLNGSTSSATLTKPSPSEDYFTVPNNAPTKRRRISLPPDDTVTVEQLVKYQGLGSKAFRILLIDVRSRSDFDSGHIMSSATICIEPEILQRENISAEQLAEALVLGPAQEQHHFESRHEFDLVVFYDQESQNFTQTAALSSLYYALTTYDFPGKEESASRHPKVLKGGLDAWTSTMGNALQTSSTLDGTGIKPSRALRKRAPSLMARPILRRASTPVQDAGEVRRWEQHLTPVRDVDAADKEGAGEEEPEFIDTTDSFLRRYPPASQIRESMMSPVLESPTKNPLHMGPPSHPTDIYSSLPSPPARPPPAVPRPSYTGLRDSDDLDHTSLAKITKRAEIKTRRRAVGLQNPGNWCYANSTLQSLYASAGFADELVSGNWQHLYHAPKKPNEKIMPPQLLTKILANLFYWMGNGRFPTMLAKTLMEYAKHITSRDSKRRRDNIFGSMYQQDAHEFMSWLIDELHEETNIYRDRPQAVEQPKQDGRSIFCCAQEYWGSWSRANASIVDKYWRGLQANITICSSCQHVTTTFQTTDVMVLTTPSDTGTATIGEMLRENFRSEALDDYKCDGCGRKGTVQTQTRLARFPDLLCICFGRFLTLEGTGAESKISTSVEFPVRDLDLTPFSIPRDQHPGGDGVIDHHFEGPFKYDAYAVVQHSGSISGGHYISMIRDEAGGDVAPWHVANDEVITSLEVGNSRGDKGCRRLYGDGGRNGLSAYIVLYQRQKDSYR